MRVTFEKGKYFGDLGLRKKSCYIKLAASHAGLTGLISEKFVS
jgi:hypothetical protein